ncbi:MAG: hypothetical protein FWH10_06125 [Oscillospiraceae bacterium]|nr:hypothetical protein [Oscillospiraceae bacterium]
MTSKQRVMRGFDRVKADRVPINYCANAGIDARLKAHFGLRPEDNTGLLDALNVDFRPVSPAYTGKVLHENIPGRRIDPLWGIHMRWIEHSSGGYWDYCDFPLEFASEEEIAEWKMPSPDDFDYEGLSAQINRYKDYAKPFNCYGDLINTNGMLRGMEQTLVDIITDDPAGLLLAKRRFDFHIAQLDRVLHHAKGGVDFVWFGEDLGTQDRQMISMDVFRRNIKPWYKKMLDVCESYNIPAIMHTCGSSSWAYEELIEIGVKGFDTLQPEAKNMSPEYLVEKFGGRVVFHGCISTAGALANGAPDDVREEVRSTLEIMKPTYSYWLAPTHAIQDNSPTENVVEMYRAALELGKY